MRSGRVVPAGTNKIGDGQCQIDDMAGNRDVPASPTRQSIRKGTWARRTLAWRRTSNRNCRTWARARETRAEIGKTTRRTKAPLSDIAPHPEERRKPMGLFSKDIATMDDLFVHTLRDMYYAENDMIEKATDAQLKQGFQTHLGETKNQIKRLEQVFRLHGVEIMGVDCPAIDGIIEEADDVVGEVDNKNVLDAALIAAAQAVEDRKS